MNTGCEKCVLPNFFRIFSTILPRNLVLHVLIPCDGVDIFQKDTERLARDERTNVFLKPTDNLLIRKKAPLPGLYLHMVCHDSAPEEHSCKKFCGFRILIYYILKLIEYRLKCRTKIGKFSVFKKGGVHIGLIYFLRWPKRFLAGFAEPYRISPTLENTRELEFFPLVFGKRRSWEFKRLCNTSLSYRPPILIAHLRAFEGDEVVFHSVDNSILIELI